MGCLYRSVGFFESPSLPASKIDGTIARHGGLIRIHGSSSRIYHRPAEFFSGAFPAIVCERSHGQLPGERLRTCVKARIDVRSIIMSICPAEHFLSRERTVINKSVSDYTLYYTTSEERDQRLMILQMHRASWNVR